MKREIKFRGMTIGGQWQIGNLTILKKDYRDKKAGYYISNSVGLPFAFMVRPESVGQFTGFKDKNGQELYEGDICETKKSYESSCNKSLIIYEDDGYFFDSCYRMNERMLEFEENYIKVIGNCYDNPNLKP